MLEREKMAGKSTHVNMSEKISLNEKMPPTGKPCKYCKTINDDLESYKCDGCYSLSHLACMKCKKPSRLKGDLLFMYECKECHFEKKDNLTRMKLSWVQVIHLTLYNLTVAGHGRQGYFRWKEEICGFIEKHWNILMPGKLKGPTWIGTIAGTLSVHSHNLFKSGQTLFNETGWWGLQEVSVPKANPENYRISRTPKNTEPLKIKPDIANITLEYGRGKRQRKPKDKKGESPTCGKVAKIETPKVKTIPLILPHKIAVTTPAACVNAIKVKKEPIEYSEPNKKNQNNIKKSKATKFSMKTNEEDKKTTKDHFPKNSVVQGNLPKMQGKLQNTTILQGIPPKAPVLKEESTTKKSTESFHKLPDDSNCAIMAELSNAGYSNGVLYDDPFASLFDDMSAFELPPSLLKDETMPLIPPTVKVKTEPIDHEEYKQTDTAKETLVNTSPIVTPIATPILTPTFIKPLENLNFIKPIEKTNDVTPLTVKEENEFLAKINNYPLTVESDCSVRRLRRKLLNRKLKRDLGIPLFSIDKQAVKVETNVQPKPIETNEKEQKTNTQNIEKQKQSFHHPALIGVNVLDKFCQFRTQNLRNISNASTRRSLISLIGISEDFGGYQNSIVSPYTSRILKPYIRRDFATLPPKLKVLRDIQSRCPVKMHRAWPIDYCYVQPMHIPAVNSLCSDFFWPGIDLTECLQYPEFSCIVLYRKLLIGFAFMVPDVKFNEAYISFILVHPDWRRSGIASNMIYHLIQTCMGKDITLHVSPSNPSMLLYQKFGFKAEALILDFYNKYIPEEDKSSKHAFLLRLQR